MRRYTDAERRRAVKDFECGGISAAEFCRRRGMSSVSLAQWRRRYSGNAHSVPSAVPPWLPVVIADAGPPTGDANVAYVMIAGPRCPVQGVGSSRCSGTAQGVLRSWFPVGWTPPRQYTTPAQHEQHPRLRSAVAFPQMPEFPLASGDRSCYVVSGTPTTSIGLMPAKKKSVTPAQGKTLEAHLWDAADKMRNNMDEAEYSRADRDRLPQAARRMSAEARINTMPRTSSGCPPMPAGPTSRPAPRARTAVWQSAKSEVRVSKRKARGHSSFEIQHSPFPWPTLAPSTPTPSAASRTPTSAPTPRRAAARSPDREATLRVFCVAKDNFSPTRPSTTPTLRCGKRAITFPADKLTSSVQT
jgi:hypothetical protein